MARRRQERNRTGEPYVKIHNERWHLFYRNPNPSKPYPAHKSLRLEPDARRKAETIEAEARLVWRECEDAFELDPSEIDKVFTQFVADKVVGRKAKAAKEATSEYLEKMLEEVLDEFLASKQGKAKRTRKSYKSHVNQIRRVMDCRKAVMEIQPDDILQYLETRVVKEGLHKRTANKELTTLRSVFSFAQKRDYLVKNPAKMVDRFSLEPQDKEQLSEPVYVPDETYKALIKSEAARARPPVRTVMFLLYHTGMRIGELLRLRWGDVDIKTKVFHVTASPQKGGDRTPYMVSRQLRLFLRFARQESERAYRSGRWQTDAQFDRIAVIPNGHGMPWTYNNLANRIWWPFMQDFAGENSEVYAELQAAAGTTGSEKRPVSFHDFRHTFITDLLTKGVNPIVVGWLVGHKELHTQRRYTHLCYSHFQKEFEGFKR